MDFRNIINIIIPAGRVNKISIGGVVYWNKAISAGNKYKIMKNDVQVAEVTMSRLVKQVNSGVAQENYGIGAQLIVPYHDSWNNQDYELPFNFGTFTAYGEGKLGLQAHYAIPTSDVSHGNVSSNNYFCFWKDSYPYKWLNAYGTEYEITNNGNYTNRNGFLSCIPEDFVDIMNTTSHGNFEYTMLGYVPDDAAYERSEETLVSGKIFLPGPSNSNMATMCGSYNNWTSYGDGDWNTWEYWINRMGSSQFRDSPSSITKVRQVAPIQSPSSTFKVWQPSKVFFYPDYIPYQAYFLADGTWGYQRADRSARFLPACVIG